MKLLFFLARTQAQVRAVKRLDSSRHSHRPEVCSNHACVARVQKALDCVETNGCLHTSLKPS